MPLELLAEPRTQGERVAETARRLAVNATDLVFFALVVVGALGAALVLLGPAAWLATPLIGWVYGTWIVTLAHRPGADLSMGDLAALPLARGWRILVMLIQVWWRGFVLGLRWIGPLLVVIALQPVINLLVPVALGVFITYALLAFRVQLATVLACLPPEHGGDDPVAESELLVASALPDVVVADVVLAVIGTGVSLAGLLLYWLMWSPTGLAAECVRLFVMALAPAVHLTYLNVLAEDCRRASTRTL